MMSWLQSIIIVLALVSSTAHASNYIYVASEPNYSGLGALKLGIGDWEFGKNSRDSYGINKVFRFNESYFTGFGFVLSAGSSNFGLTGLMGFEYRFLSVFGFRGELYAIADMETRAQGAANLGFSFHF